MIKFVVYADNRSGSHFLQSLLHDHPAINCYWDIFWSRDETPLGFGSYCSEIPARGMSGLFAKRKLIYGFLNHHFAGQYARQGGVDASGFLLKYGAVQRYSSVVKWLRANDVRIVHIIRSNHLNHEIAFALRRTEIVKSHARTPLAFRSVRLDTVNLVKRLDAMQRRIKKAREKIAKCKVIEIEYEDLLVNREREISRICSFLNVAAWRSLQSEFYKTESENPKEMVENYEEVRNALLGTRYEMYL